MAGDVIGVHVDSKQATANHTLICLEVTDEVIDEAVTMGCDSILAFHPLIYMPLARVDRAERVGRLVSRLIEADVALLCIHTAFDAFPQGTNALLSERLGLTIIGPLRPVQREGFGMGLVTETARPIAIEDFVETVRLVCNSPVRYTKPPGGLVHKVVIVAGSGMQYYSDAVASGAEAFITADIRYHGYHAATNIIGLIDPGHYEMEQFVPEGIMSALQNSILGHATLTVSSVVTNPIRYAFRTNSEYSQHHLGSA
jgi:dinuclear metal center YbgI/SA1388 family protein